MYTTDPIRELKATARRWPEMIDEWRQEATRRQATHIVIYNDSFLAYEDAPVYVTSAAAAEAERVSIEGTSGMYYVQTVVV